MVKELKYKIKVYKAKIEVKGVKKMMGSSNITNNPNQEFSSY